MPLNLYTVYCSPLDYLGKFVVRRFELDQPREVCVIGDTLDEVRERLLRLAGPLYCLPRQPADDPNIVEVWL